MIAGIIQQCRERATHSLEQVQTKLLPAGYSGYSYHFEVYYAHEKKTLLRDIEASDISILPIGKAPFDRAPADWKSEERLEHRQDVRGWRPRRWYASHGVGIYTGETSGQDGANWHDIEFTHTAIKEAPDTVLLCLEALVGAVVHPLIALTHDGGIRFSCRIPDYLHPDTADEKAYICYQKEVCVNIKGAKDYSVWDARCEIAEGSLLNPPVIASNVLFAILNIFRRMYHNPSFPLNTETPTKPQILVEMPDADKIARVRSGELSPLGIQRPKPVLAKSDYEAPEPFDIDNVLSSDAKVIGISTGFRYPDDYREIERLFLERSPLILNLPSSDYCKTADDYWTAEGYSIGAYWQPDTNADKIEGVPRDELLKDPFGRGNLCIDPERWQAICLAGGNANKIICAKCPVKTECYQRGHHSQYEHLARADIGIVEYKEFKTRQQILNPMWFYSVAPFFEEKKRIGILSSMYATDLFAECRIGMRWIKEWVQNWQGAALGDFAQALLNAIEISNTSKEGSLVARLRSVMNAFASVEPIIKKQMTQINIAPEGETPVGISMIEAVDSGFIDISDKKNIQNNQRVFPEDRSTYFDMLQRFFNHYKSNADAPMFFDRKIPDAKGLQFWVPPMVHNGLKKLVILSPIASKPHLEKAFPDEKVAVYDFNSAETLKNNKVYQLRSAVHSPHSMMNYDVDWDTLTASADTQRYAKITSPEIQGTPETQHRLLLHAYMDTVFQETLKNDNTQSSLFCKQIPPHTDFFSDVFTGADVVWLFGTPYWPPNLTWKHARILYGDDPKQLDYSLSIHPYHFKDERLQLLSETYSIQGLLGMLAYVELSEGGKTIVLNSALHVPGITDAPETLLFDWEDLEIAGGLDGLPETITRREAYETEAAQIDGTWMPYQLMHVLGVDRNEANRILRDDYGLKGVVPVRQEILSLMKHGKTQVKEMLQVLSDRHITTVHGELKKMRNEGIINRVGWGRYELTDETDKN